MLWWKIFFDGFFKDPSGWTSLIWGHPTLPLNIISSVLNQTLGFLTGNKWGNFWSNKCSDRSTDVELPFLLENFDGRPTNWPINRPADWCDRRQTASKGSFTSNDIGIKGIGIQLCFIPLLIRTRFPNITFPFPYPFPWRNSNPDISLLLTYWFPNIASYFPSILPMAKSARVLMWGKFSWESDSPRRGYCARPAAWCSRHLSS